MWRAPAAAVPSWCCITRPARSIACRSTMRWPRTSTCWCRIIPATAARSGRTGCAACATSPSIYRGLLAELGISERRAGRPRLRRLDRRRDGQPWRPPTFRRLVLVGAMGIKPPQGDILDQAHRQLHRLRPRRLPRPEGVRPRLRRRAVGRPARAVGHLPRDELPHRLEALHVQPDAAASAGRRARAGARRVGRRRQDRAAERRQALREALPNARLEIVKACGHCVDMEQPEALAKLVTDVHRRRR